MGGWLTGERALMRDGNQFLLIWCVFRWFWRNEVKCYVSVQVSILIIFLF